ncbi:MAG: sodium:calcium antiporter [Armatimonadota bacterium]
MKRYRRHIIPIAIAALLTLPGIFLRLSGLHEHFLPTMPALVALLSGLSVLGASFLLLWACDAVQEDISQTLALAIVALIAVLPEYAVDMYITWQAGKDPSYAPLAIANMTGANRLIIGVAWMVIAVIYWIKTRRAVHIEKDRRTELFFLALATLYAFIIPIKGSLAWYDGIVFVAIYAWYIRVAGRRPCAECAADGPAELLLSLPQAKRRLATVGMFLFAAFAIAANSEQFSEGLIHTGAMLQINKALLIQWLAPIASEAPEFTVAIMFTLRKRAGLALGSLLSAKLNQWTLLVGMIPWVYAWSHGTLSHPIPMNALQMHEILLTAAQSLLAIIMLASLRFTIGQALLIFSLFAGQLVLPPILEHWPQYIPFGMKVDEIHPLFSLMYIVASIVILVENPRRLSGIWRGARVDSPTPVPMTMEAEEKPKELVGL